MNASKWIKLALVIFSFQTVSSSLGADGTFRTDNLDLPYNAFSTAADEEDGPEIVIFYGQMYETNGVFFCLDQSLSMSDGEWTALQRELVRVITEMSDSMEFGIVFFDTDATVFPTNKRSARATDANKRAAIAMVMATSATARSTCFLSGLKEVIPMADECQSKNKSIIFMSDGKATCVGEDTVTYVERTLREVQKLNKKETAINTVGVGFEVIEHFLKTLAQQNKGKYRRLPR